MSEKVVIRQKRNFETIFQALDPEAPESGKLRPVGHIQDLTPYGMLLASLGTCTAFVVNTYAQHHGIDVAEVELAVAYQRTFKEDCDHCEEIDKYEEQIALEVSFKGDLTSQEREKLFKISFQCPIHKMLKSGMKVISRHVGGHKS